MFALVQILIHGDPDQIGPFLVILHDPPDQRPDRRDRGHAIVIGVIQHRMDFLSDAVEHDAVKFLLGLEIMIDQLLGHASRLRNPVQPGAVKSILGEGIAGRSQNAIQRHGRGVARLFIRHAALLPSWLCYARVLH